MAKNRITVNGQVYELVPEDKIAPLKIGDNVKVKIKNQYASEATVHHGVIIAIDEFENPAVTVAYLDNSYKGEIKIVTVDNEEDKTKRRVEIVRKRKGELLFDRKRVLEWFNGELEKLETKKLDVERRKEYFIHHFDDAFLAVKDKLLEAESTEES